MQTKMPKYSKFILMFNIYIWFFTPVKSYDRILHWLTHSIRFQLLPQVSSSEYFTVSFEVGDFGSTVGLNQSREEFVPAVKGVTLLWVFRYLIVSIILGPLSGHYRSRIARNRSVLRSNEGRAYRLSKDISLKEIFY